MVRPTTPLMSPIRLAKAPIRPVGTALAVARIATSPAVTAVGPTVPVRLPALARLGTPRRRRALEATLPGAPGTMKGIPRSAAPSVTVAPRVEAVALATAQPRPAIGLPSADAAGLRVLEVATVRPACGAIVPAVELLRWTAPVRQGRPAVGTAVVGVGQPTREGLLAARPRTLRGPDLASEADPIVGPAPTNPARRRAPTGVTIRTP